MLEAREGGAPSVPLGASTAIRAAERSRRNSQDTIPSIDMKFRNSGDTIPIIGMRTWSW
jgi:hypothetical protein